MLHFQFWVMSRVIDKSRRFDILYINIPNIIKYFLNLEKRVKLLRTEMSR